MKKVIALLLLLATMLAITSCEKPSEEDIMLSALLSYAVPGVFFEEQGAAEYAVLDMRYKEESGTAAEYFLANGYEEFYNDGGNVLILKKKELDK